MSSRSSAYKQDLSFSGRAALGRAQDPAADSQGGADIRDFFRILRARSWMVLAPAAAATALALAYLVLATPSYTATTSILIDARARAPIGSELQNTAAFPDSALVESQLKLIASDTVLRRVVISEKLADDPEFAPSAPGLRTRLFTFLGIWPAIRPNDDAANRTLMSLGRNVSVRRSERTYVIDIDVSSGDPVKAARLANAIAKAYLTDQQDAKLDQSKRESDWLKSRLEDLQSRLQDAENRVEAYKSENKIIGANGKLLGDQQLGDVTTSALEARARTAEARSKLDQINRIIASGKAPDATADALKSGLIEKLRGQYADVVRQEANYRATLGPRHPALAEVEQQLREVRRLISDELKRLAEAASNEYQIARSNEAALERQSDSLKKSTVSTNQSLVRLRELEREVDANRSVYEKFLRARETVKEEAIENPIGRIIAPASAPLSPSSPRQFAILSLALLGGLAFGTGAAFLAEFFAPDAGSAAKPRTPHTVNTTQETRPALAVLPALYDDPPRSNGWRSLFRRSPDAAAQTARNLSSASEPDAAYLAAVQDLAEKLSNPDTGLTAQTFLITSTGSATGKTTLAINLARAAARRGQRTLLIEANAENPSLDALVTAKSKSGILELRTEKRAVYLVDPLGSPNLYVAPLRQPGAIGTAHRRVLAGLRFEGLKSSFDCIFYDGTALSDETAQMLAAAVDCVIMAETSADNALTPDDLEFEFGLSADQFSGLVVCPHIDGARSVQQSPQKQAA